MFQPSNRIEREEKREKIREKEEERYTAKEEEELEEIKEQIITKGKLSSILGFVMILLCKIIVVDVYILLEGLWICG